MAILLVVKALNLVFASEDKYYVKVMGAARGWDIWFYAFQFIKGLLFFVVTVLIGTGWSFLRPFLQKKEKIILFIGIPLQVLANIAYIVLVEMEPSSKNYEMDSALWLLVLVGIDVALYFLVTIPISWSLRSLRDTSKMDGKAITNLKRVKLFRDFYFLVMIYMLMQKFLMYAANIMYNISSDYEARWQFYVASEIMAICFYIAVYYWFRPVETNEYLAIAADEEEEERALTEIMTTRDFNDLIYDKI